MSEKLKIVYRPLQKLSPYAHNARTHSPEQVAQLVESIKQFGWTNPVLIDEKGEIIAGHGRVMAAEVLKMDSVPVIVLSGLTDDQKKAYRLADNRLPLNAAVKILHEKYRKKTPCISMGVTNDSVFESRVSGCVPDDCTTNR
ncbi:ParB/Srx family N-terminal domain-containing protein [Escherichia coli]